MALTIWGNNETFTPLKKKKKTKTNRYELVSNAIYLEESRTECDCKRWDGGMFSIVQMQLTNQVNIALTEARILNVFKKQKQTSVQFSSVAHSCPTLCNLMNCSTPGLPVHHQLLEFTQIHFHQVSDTIQPSHPLSSPSPPALNPSQHQILLQ